MTKTLACAIYTRKSSEEGLDQAFNSLHAQREACEAFILSQRHEGWRLVDDRYDDGGYSGGSMERPGLTRLLTDIRHGSVDVVVVYKVDRLTRSLADFSKMIALFDQREISFVSITQQFNTTTSMGRLTLNVLLSFAQFEREVTGERIRDKIAASKRKGMWMGGYPPLGYDVKDRRLVVNEVEAEIVRIIFKGYLELRCVRKLKARLDASAVVSKIRIGLDGATTGAKPLSRGTLYNMLKNPLFIGQVSHKGQVFDGEHDAIVDSETWEHVQTALTKNRDQTANGLRAKCPSLLAGKLFDDKGNRISPSHAVKSKKRYRYYVSQANIQDRKEQAGSISRIPCDEIERLVRSELQQFVRSEERVHESLGRWCSYPQLASSTGTRETIAESLDTETALLRKLLCRVTIAKSAVTMEVSPMQLLKVLLIESDPDTTDEQPAITWTVATELKRSGGETKLIIGNKAASAADPRPVLIKAIARGYAWNQELLRAESPSIRALARKYEVDERHVRRHLPLALLAPDIIEAIIDGRARTELTVHQLYRKLPLRWEEQRKVLGFT